MCSPMGRSIRTFFSICGCQPSGLPPGQGHAQYGWPSDRSTFQLDGEVRYISTAFCQNKGCHIVIANPLILRGIRPRLDINIMLSVSMTSGPSPPDPLPTTYRSPAQPRPVCSYWQGHGSYRRPATRFNPGSRTSCNSPPLP